ncbi:lantibiotic dehydratase [Kitasatospora sp. MAP5-34]|uniref:lantibiotic dehydratase n=1 Tax=Kitasatospora sp. MAP5-34 TaxID=3035102 RepID=UPI0024770B36|nr:lantibiotic dehydratase [Kitasatospora sp. MAP5-34]MDH6574906.1 hypothetical protein [Kitasatospora sp. MAP5-34]
MIDTPVGIGLGLGLGVGLGIDVAPAAPGAVSVAPYAVVRTVALPAPQPSPVGDEYRAQVGRLVGLTAWCEQAGPELCDALYELAGSARPDARGRVLLPLRRDVHNRRSPRPSLRAAWADLARQLPSPSSLLPLLDEWLTARDEIDRIGALLDALTGPALESDRTALAALCRAEELQRAVALTSADLLRAVRRAAAQGADPDRGARKSEATVLRYAMRAVTKTAPLSWFSHVGWGRWNEWHEDADVPGPGLPGAAEPSAVTQVDRWTLEALVQAVLRRPELRAAARYRLVPGLRSDGSQLVYRRTPLGEGTSAQELPEEQVTVPLSAPLRHVLATVGAGGAIQPGALASGIAARLGGPREEAERAATAYVGSLIDQGLLQPVYPVDPQSADVVRETADWLAEVGLVEPAAVLADIGADTERYARLPAAARPPCLDRIRSRWSQAFALVGAVPTGHRAPLTEDVAVRTVQNLGGGHGSGALLDLARLAPLFELFDEYAVIRRMARDRFVARFGVGGSCDVVGEFADEFTDTWRALDLVDQADPAVGSAAAPGDGQPVGREVRELLRLRAELAAAVTAFGSGGGSGGGTDGGEVVLPEEVVAEAARRGPGWLRRRPASYGVFVQPVPADGATRLCVNHVYGGWGRFTSRYLDHLDPSAKALVSARIADALPGAERVAQIRPVLGFNANLHPLLVAEEVSDLPDLPAWAMLRPEQLQLVHDDADDQLRLRVAATGELVNVLYLGFLSPFVLPRRLMPMLNDLGSGIVDLGKGLVPTRSRDTAVGRIRYRPRLRYREVIVSRAKWLLTAETVRAWRADLDQEPPALATSRWRAQLGIPERVFVAAAPPEDGTALSAVTSFFEQPKSQYVDLGSALHLRCLSRTLARYPGGVILEEALPEPRVGAYAVEIVAETYRSHP